MMMQEKKGSGDYRPKSAQVVIGLIVIGVGMLLLAQTVFGLRGFSIWRFFPLLFVFLGVWQLVENGFRAWLGPLVLIVGAGMVQLGLLGMVPWGLFQAFWPLLLILVGGTILLRQWRGDDDALPVSTGGRFNALALFGGVNKRVVSADFQAGEATAIFGGVEVDLSEAVVAERPAVVEVLALFGGVNFRVSADTLLELRVTPLFGGATDERRHQRKALPGESPEMVIRGMALFGGVSVQNAKVRKDQAA